MVVSVILSPMAKMALLRDTVASSPAAMGRGSAWVQDPAPSTRSSVESVTGDPATTR